MNILLIFFGKILSKVINLLNLGSGETWPGHIALNINDDFIKQTLRNSKSKIILVAGTNGKTTTSKLIQTILSKNERKIMQNTSGANLLNGIASALIFHSNILGKFNYDFAIFEVDENTLPSALKEFTPDFIILLNLFRDQLDRYGEINTIALKWKNAIEKLPLSTKLILNANDPQIAFLGREKNTFYFGLNERSKTPKIPNNADSVFCPRCNSELRFEELYFSHIGKWVCGKCSFKTPKLNLHNAPYYPLFGNYNKFNTLASVLLAKEIGLNSSQIKNGLLQFKPAFGRQEEILKNGKKIKIFLSKNPTSFNESLRTIGKVKTLLLILNDRIPDGRDVSWIWDVDFEKLLKSSKIVISGDRVFDLAIRLKYADQNNFKIVENLNRAIKVALRETSRNGTLYILPTYSSMLDAREIITGRKIS